MLMRTFDSLAVMVGVSALSAILLSVLVLGCLVVVKSSGGWIQVGAQLVFVVVKGKGEKKSNPRLMATKRAQTSLHFRPA